LKDQININQSVTVNKTNITITEILKFNNIMTCKYNYSLQNEIEMLFFDLTVKGIYKRNYGTSKQVERYINHVDNQGN